MEAFRAGELECSLVLDGHADLPRSLLFAGADAAELDALGVPEPLRCPYVCLLVRGPGEAAIFAGLYTVLNVLIGNVLEPRVLGRALGLSPLVVLLSMIFWGWLWGPLGALLAVPLTMAAKIVLSHTDGGKPIAVLLGPPVIPPRNSKLPPPPEPEAAKAVAESPAERSAAERA